MNYRHSFDVDRPQIEVLEFHRHPSTLVDITPPPIIMRLESAHDPLQEGDEMTFTTWIGPIPIRWRSRIEDVNEIGFTDRQISGPFRTWVHRHDFLPAYEARTTVRDEIEIAFRPHPIWFFVALGMTLGLPVLFAYRAWKTREVLDRT